MVNDKSRKENILKEVLTREGISQSKLQKITDLSLTTINKVANNRRRVSDTTKSRIVIGINKLLREIHEENRSYKVEDIFPVESK